MATTFTKAILKPVYPQGANLEFVSMYAPEGASQTFVNGDVLTWTGGYLVLGAAAAAVAIAGISLQSGNNTTAGTNNIQYAPAYPGMFIMANLLTTSAADHTLVATNMGVAYELERSTTLVSGSDPGWYINTAATSTPAAKVVSFYGDQDSGTTYAQVAQVGDINVRALCSILDAQCAFVTA